MLFPSVLAFLSLSAGFVAAQTATVTNGLAAVATVTAAASGNAAVSQSSCGSDAVVAITGVIVANPLVYTCGCVNSSSAKNAGVAACPACPANAQAVCSSGSGCGCQCATGLTLQDGQCVVAAAKTDAAAATKAATKAAIGALQTAVTAAQVSLGADAAASGVLGSAPAASAAVIPAPVVAGPTSVTPPAFTPPPANPSVRARRAKKSVVVVDEKLRRNLLFCPSGETPCGLSSGGYECVDVTAALDSCGGCVGPTGNGEGVNCLSIPGALGVSCVASQCEVSSCFPGWRFKDGKCSRK